MEDRSAVSEPSSSPPAGPAWVRKRDGRLVPFEADKISRALFAATEGLGRPDAFLARELTDGVVHFLALEVDGTVPTTEQVAEMTAKVVRELGQPALAQAFTEFTRQKRERQAGGGGRETASGEVALRFSAGDPLHAVLQNCRRVYTLHAVFARDLVAAQGDGLLTLTGLEAPFELAGCVHQPAAGQGLVEAVEEARQAVGGFLVFDGPEHALAQQGDDGAGWLRELGIGLRSTGLAAVVNLNGAAPPSWADDLAEGPLFGAGRRPLDRPRVSSLADALLDGLLRLGATDRRVRIDWHLGERDFLPGEQRLPGLLRAALGGAPLAFVFDRSRRPVPLAEGVDRQHPAVLLTVGLHLPRLAEQVAPGSGAPQVFLNKLGSLARLALSAAVQKREFLRHHSQERPAVTRGFLLNRARLVVAPAGLEDAVRLLLGRDPGAGGPALGFARQVVQRLRDVLRAEGGSCRLETCVDRGWPELEAEPVPGGPVADGKSQLRAAADLGTAAVLLDGEDPPTAEQAADWLRWAWQHTDLARLRLVRLAGAPRQLTVPWPDDSGR
jgi:hypothetical protein